MIVSAVSSFRRQRLTNCVALICFAFVSCSQVPHPEPQNQKSTVPVSGFVYIDGEPGWGVRITMNHQAGVDPSNPTLSTGEGKLDGAFTIGTYGVDDGAPPGDYVLTFERFDRSKPRLGGGKPPDLFKGKLADPETSEHTVKVTGDEPFVDLGLIELITPE